MDSDRWHRIKLVLDAALTRNPDEWPGVLDETCSADPELRAEVEALLARVTAAEGFLESPPAALASALVAETLDLDAGPSLEGRRLGAYRLIREIGRGGMSRVFLAERADGQFDQRVAVKLLRAGLDSDVDRARFRSERQILATLNHPNIARLLDGGVTDDGLPYLVLELVDGLPIDRWCDERGLSVEERLELFLTVADAVQYAHSHLVVHRDLKPSNIFVAEDGTVKLLDFGLARMLEPDSPLAAHGTTRTGHRWFTPEYAAPEQIRGEAVTTLTDVWQLGVVLYQLLTGALPFAGDTLRRLEEAVLHDEPRAPSSVRPALRGDLDAVVLQALRREPEWRYASVLEMATDVRRHRSGHPVHARRQTLAYRAGRFVRRHRSGVAVAAGIAVLLAAGVARERALRARAQAESHKAEAVERFLVSTFNVADPFAPPDVRGPDVTARALLDRGAQRIDSLSTAPEVQAELREVFGQVYTNLGLFSRAVPELRQALRQRRALAGPDDSALVVLTGELGMALLGADSLDEAEPLLRQELSESRRLFGEESEQTAAGLDHLATLMQERSDYAHAEPLFRESVAIRRRLHGDADLSVATSESNLGLVLWFKGDYDEAERFYRHAIAIDERKLGVDHPVTAQVVQNLAQVEEMRGSYAAAESLYRRSLSSQRKTLGDLHPSVTLAMNNLGALLTVRNRPEEAEPLIRQAVALDRRMFGDGHSYVASGLGNLGWVLQMEGKFDEAERAYGEELAIVQKLYGKENAEIALGFARVGSVRLAKGDLAGAVSSFRESLAQYRHMMGETHPNTLTLSINLANALRESGRLDEAEQLFRSVLGKLVDSKTAKQRALRADANVGLGQILTARGRPKDARPLLEQSLTTHRAQWGAESWRTARDELALGECLAALHDAGADSMLAESDRVLRTQRRAQPRLAAKAEAALAKFRARSVRAQ